MKPKKLSNFSRPGLEIVGMKGVAKKRAAQRVCKAVQNEMIGILARMITDAELKTYNSANS